MCLFVCVSMFAGNQKVPDLNPCRTTSYHIGVVVSLKILLTLLLVSTGHLAVTLGIN